MNRKIQNLAEDRQIPNHTETYHIFHIEQEKPEEIVKS